MRIEARKVGKISILDLSGQITIADTPKLRECFKELIESGEQLFIFNLLRVPWLDSSGVGQVVACYWRARERGGIIKLVLKERAHDLFVNFELGKIFEIFDDLEEAIASFAS